MNTPYHFNFKTVCVCVCVMRKSVKVKFCLQHSDIGMALYLQMLVVYIKVMGELPKGHGFRLYP